MKSSVNQLRGERVDCAAGDLLDERFFDRPAIELAPALIGTIVVRRIGGVVRRARIVETEAYLGPADLACHSARGRTRRTEVMFGRPGRAYVYFIYGMHWMFNVVSGPEGGGQAVLIRGATPLDGWEANLIGPGRLARALGITGADNATGLFGDALHFTAGDGSSPRIRRTKRIGINYAGRWKDRLLRFIDGST